MAKQDWEIKLESLWRLNEAVANAELEKVASLLAQGRDLSQRDSYGRTALQSAAMLGRPRGLALMCQALGGKERQELLNQALLDASQFGNWRCVNVLLQAGAAPNAIEAGFQKQGDRPLTLAAMAAYPRTVRTLLEGGADPDLTNSTRSTALMRASAKPTPHGFGYCVGGGKLPGAGQGGDPDGEAYFDCGVQPEKAGEQRRECLAILIKAGANLDLRNDFGFNASQLAADSGDIQALIMLGEAGADWSKCHISCEAAEPELRARLKSVVEGRQLREASRAANQEGPKIRL